MKKFEIPQVTLDMLDYFRGDFRRIAHAQKVHGFTRLVAGMEGTGEKRKKLLECAAVLHDIGIPEAIRIHGSGAPAFQEMEGARIAYDLLAGYAMDEVDRMWVRDAVGAHHTYEKVEELGFRILFEADCLVNIMEKNVDDSAENVAEIRRKYFATPSALKVFDTLFFPKGP